MVKKFTIFITSDADLLGKKFKTLMSRFPKELVKVTVKSAIDTKNKAASLAPYDTGKTRDGIISAVQYQGKDKINAIIGYKKNPHPDKKWGRKEFILPYWLNFSSLAPSHSTYDGKDPRFMWTAQRWSAENFPKRVKFQVSKVLKEVFK